MPEGDFTKKRYNVEELQFIDIDDDVHLIGAKDGTAPVLTINGFLFFDMRKFNYVYRPVGSRAEKSS